MPSAADDNPCGGESARGSPAFFREWKRMHREATRDGGDDDHAYDEGAAMFAHQVATRSTSLGEDYENELTPKERVRHHRHLRKLRREVRDKGTGIYATPPTRRCPTSLTG